MATSNETATYIGDLPTSPTIPIDSLAGGRSRLGAEMRKTKQIMKETGPNWTGPINATHTELNYIVGLTSAAQTQIDAKPDASTVTLNADTDVSGNAWVLDEDDFASDSATKVPTQQSAKAYADSKGPTATVPILTTAGTSVTVKTGIPAGVTTIEVVLDGVTLSGIDDILIQIGDSGGLETTVYVGSGSIMGSAAASNNYTTGFGVNTSDSAGSYPTSGSVTLINVSGNKWIARGVCAIDSGAAATYATAGVKSLSGTLTTVALATLGGSVTFTAGLASVVYQ